MKVNLPINLKKPLLVAEIGINHNGSLNIAKNETKSSPLKFYEAILFQFVNPKAWTVAIMVASGFFPREENLIADLLCRKARKIKV